MTSLLDTSTSGDEHFSKVKSISRCSLVFLDGLYINFKAKELDNVSYVIFDICLFLFSCIFPFKRYVTQSSVLFLVFPSCAKRVSANWNGLKLMLELASTVSLRLTNPHSQERDRNSLFEDWSEFARFAQQTKSEKKSLNSTIHRLSLDAFLSFETDQTSLSSIILRSSLFFMYITHTSN